MAGKPNQYDPSEFFKEWILKSGKAQKEFMETFNSMMTQNPTKSLDPLDTLKDMASKAEQTQSVVMDNISSMQQQALKNMLSFGQGFSNLLSYSAFKTTIGSNGRISIPEAERGALGLNDGDLVQVIVIPISKKQKKE